MASGSRELKVTSKHKTPPHLHAPAALFAGPSAHLYGVFPSPHYSSHNGVSNWKPCRSRTRTARSRVANRGTEKKSSDSAASFLNSGWAAAPPHGAPPPPPGPGGGGGGGPRGGPRRPGAPSPTHTQTTGPVSVTRPRRRHYVTTARRSPPRLWDCLPQDLPEVLALARKGGATGKGRGESRAGRGQRERKRRGEMRG